MKPALLVIGTLVVAAFVASAVGYARTRAVPALLQFLGGAFLIVVVCAHVAEGLHLLPSMGWGLPNSPGHYVDLLSAVAGIALYAIGSLLGAVRKRS